MNGQGRQARVATAEVLKLSPRKRSRPRGRLQRSASRQGKTRPRRRSLRSKGDGRAAEVGAAVRRVAEPHLLEQTSRTLSVESDLSNV
jgi:hypothetical protein